MSETLTVASHRGEYAVEFVVDGLARLEAAVGPKSQVLLDRNIADIYRSQIPSTLASPSTVLLDANESTKSLESLPAIVNRLVASGIRRDHVLIAVGGGVIQDVASFLAATLLRGISWWLWPTTLLAQADSCIGSKSSINCGSTKNILGTFVPPRRIFLDTQFLKSLAPHDVRSGIGEMLKVHAIAGPEAFDRIAGDYEALATDAALMRRYIRASLEIKKGYVERDEFDVAERNIFNYGHSFGHAIEAATDFAVPHGIAVSMGCDMANFVAARLEVGSFSTFERMHVVLARNFRGFDRQRVPMDRFLSAISKDKKNLGSARVTLILPDRSARLMRSEQPNDMRFADICAEYLESGRLA